MLGCRVFTHQVLRSVLLALVCRVLWLWMLFSPPSPVPTLSCVFVLGWVWHCWLQLSTSSYPGTGLPFCHSAQLWFLYHPPWVLVCPLPSHGLESLWSFHCVPWWCPARQCSSDSLFTKSWGGSPWFSSPVVCLSAAPQAPHSSPALPFLWESAAAASCLVLPIAVTSSSAPPASAPLSACSTLPPTLWGPPGSSSFCLLASLSLILSSPTKDEGEGDTTTTTTGTRRRMPCVPTAS